MDEEEKKWEKKKCYLDRNLTKKKEGTLSSWLSMPVLAHIHSEIKTTKNLVSYYVVVLHNHSSSSSSQDRMSSIFHIFSFSSGFDLPSVTSFSNERIHF
jgi:hypothetical protein